MADWTLIPGVPNCFDNNTPNAEGVATIKCLEPLFANVVIALLELTGVALFIMLLIGGFNFLFAGGDMKKLEKARGTLTAAITGLIIVVVAYLILSTIGEIVNIPNITTFQINWN